MIVDDGRPVPALERAIRILDALAGPCLGGARAAELQARTRIPPASFFRILKALHRKGLVQQSAQTGRYHLGPAVMFLGFQARRWSPLVAAATPVLRELSSATHQMSELSAAIGDWHLMMLETWQAERSSLGILARPGLLFELDPNTAPGRCYLAFDETFSLRRYLRDAESKKDRPRLRTPSGLTADCERARRLGYCWHKQSGGNARVSAPIYDPTHPRRLLGALSIACDNREFSPLRAAQWGPQLIRGAEAIVARLSSGARTP